MKLQHQAKGQIHRIVIAANESYRSEIDLGIGRFGLVKKFRKYENPDNFSVGEVYAIKLPFTEKAHLVLKEVKILKLIKQQLIRKGKRYYVEYITDWVTYERSKQYCQPTSATEQGSDDKIKGHQILLQYCSNRSLKAYAEIRNNNQPFQHEEILYFAREILKAIKHLHEVNVVHRDIKPDNILLDKDFNIKLCDFGISLQIPQNNHPIHPISNCVGTPTYIAPEIIEKQSYNSLVDEWSAGISILELMTMKKDPSSLYTYRLKPKSIGSSADLGNLTTLLLALLKKNPKERKSAREILEQSNIFVSLQGREKEIKEKLRQRKNKYRVQTKKVFYIRNFGYCVVLENCRTFLVTQPKRGSPEIIELDNKLLEQRLMNNWEGKMFDMKSQLYQNRMKDIDAVCYMVPKEYLSFMEKWRKQRTIDAFADDNTYITKVEVVNDRVLCLKLSNSTVQFFFASLLKEPENLVFDLRISFNYNRKQPQKVCFCYKDSSSVEKQFKQFLEDKDKRQYAVYIQQTFRDWAVKMRVALFSKGFLIEND